MRMPTVESVKRALVPAAIGGVMGLLAWLVRGILSGHNLTSESAATALFATLLGAFLAWWVWLFCGALKADLRIRWLAIPGILGFAVFIFLMERSNLHLANRFRQDGAPTQAIVTGVFPEEHNHIRYRYTVGTTNYEAKDFAPGDAKDWEIGRAITIHYLRSDPSVSVSRYPTDTLGSVITFSLLGSCWLVSGVVNMYFYGRRPA